MHTVVSDECTGCELCVSPCPVDCIDIITYPEKQFENEKKIIARNRFQARNKRLAAANETKKSALATQSSLKRKKYIADALLRAKNKRNQSCSQPSFQLQAQPATLPQKS